MGRESKEKGGEETLRGEESLEGEETLGGEDWKGKERVKGWQEREDSSKEKSFNLF